MPFMFAAAKSARENLCNNCDYPKQKFALWNNIIAKLGHNTAVVYFKCKQFFTEPVDWTYWLHYLLYVLTDAMETIKS